MLGILYNQTMRTSFHQLLLTTLLLVALVPGVAAAQSVDKVTAANYAPLMNEGNEDNPGYAIEVVREAARRAGREVEISFLPFERAMYAVQNDTVSLMAALFYGKKRNDDFQWVVEIQRARLRFATLSGTFADLEDARTASSIVVESGTTSDVLLTELGFENLVRVKAPDASARMLAAGRVDAWFQDGTVMDLVWRQVEISDDLLMGDVVHEVPVFLVASPALPVTVADAYRAAVESMRADGTLDALSDRYFVE